MQHGTFKNIIDNKFLAFKLIKTLKQCVIEFPRLFSKTTPLYLKSFLLVSESLYSTSTLSPNWTSSLRSLFDFIFSTSSFSINFIKLGAVSFTAAG
jgi:hypothetical protein